MAKAKTSKGEDLLRDIGEVLKKRLTEMKAKELIEYGFYTTEGIILLFALDQVMHIDDMNRHPLYRGKHPTEYFLSLTREAVIELFERIVALGDWVIPVVQIRPFEPLKWMANPIYGVCKLFEQKQVDFGEGEGEEWATHWIAVPIPIRALIAISIPSMQFIFIEVIRDILRRG